MVTFDRVKYCGGLVELTFFQLLLGYKFMAAFDRVSKIINKTTLLAVGFENGTLQ